MRTLKLTLAYDGTRFVGWQRQAAGESIQGLLESAMARLEGRSVTVHENCVDDRVSCHL